MQDEQKLSVISWLIHNQAKVKDLAKPLDAQRTELLSSEPIEFHDDIETDYWNTLGLMIQEEIGRQLGLPVDIIIEVLQSLNLKEYMSI